MKKSILVLFTLAAFILQFSACTNEEDSVTPSTEIDVQLAQDESYAEAIFESVDYQVEVAMGNNPNGREAATVEEVDPCANLIWDLEARTLTVDFGEENCEGADGKFRRGKIIVSFTGSFIEQDKTTTVVFENFFVNDNQVEGTRAIKNLGVNEDGYLQQEITLVGGQITLTDGKTITREATWTRTWIRAQNPLDDQYILEGTASGITHRGVSYSVQIVEPLVRKKTCMLDRIFIPVEGIKEITASFEGKERVRSIDFGSGSCDKTVTITVDGESREKDLSQRPS